MKNSLLWLATLAFPLSVAHAGPSRPRW